MPVKPRPALAFAIGIGYAAMFLVLELIVNIDYDKIGESTNNVIWGIVVPVAISTLLVGLSERLVYRGLAVVGVSLDFEAVGSNGSMLLVNVPGTAVVVSQT